MRSLALIFPLTGEDRVRPGDFTARTGKVGVDNMDQFQLGRAGEVRVRPGDFTARSGKVGVDDMDQSFIRPGRSLLDLL